MPREFGQRINPSWDASRVRTLFGPLVFDTSDFSAGLQNKIILWPADGSTLSFFDPTEAGLNAAITAAATGDTIWRPSVSIALTAGVTLPTNTDTIGISQKAILSGSGFSGAMITTGAAILEHGALSFAASGSPSVAVDARTLTALVSSMKIVATGSDGVWL